MGKLKKMTIVRIVNRKNCKAILEKQLNLNAKLGFQSDARTFVSENLTAYNQHLAWKCRELK